MSHYRTALVLAVTVASVVGCGTTKQAGKKLSKSLASLVTWNKRKGPDAPPEAHLTKQQKLAVKRTLARSFENKGDLDSAIATYESLLRTDGPRAEYHHRLGVLKDKTGRGDEAVESYNAALDAGADRALVLCDCGYGLYLRGDYDEAESVLVEAISLKPDLKRAHTNLAMVHGRRGRNEEALREFSLAGCDAATSYVNLAHVLLQENKLHEASIELDHAFHADPTSEHAAKAMSMLQNLAASEQNSGTSRSVSFTE